MRVFVSFQFGPVHVPIGRRGWKDWGQVIFHDHEETQYNISLLRPRSENNHDLEQNGVSKRVADAYFPIIVECPLPTHEGQFKELSKVLVESLRPLVEQLRHKTKQPHLRLRRLQDLEFVTITTLSGDALEGPANDFKSWFTSAEPDRPLPFVSKEDWEFTRSLYKSEGQIEETDWRGHVSVHESLLLDAEGSAESDERIGIVYAALACEIFIQSFLEKSATNLSPVRLWLEAARNPDSPTSIHSLYHLGLKMVGKKSLRENKRVHSKFEKLITARNDIAHRGEVTRIKSGYSSKEAVMTAREVISWVESMA